MVPHSITSTRMPSVPICGSASTSSLYVFYDKNQHVFEMDFENAFAIDAPPYVLRYNIRNTGSIYQCAVERTNLGHDTVANNIIGVQPEIHNYTKPSQAVMTAGLRTGSASLES